MHPLPSVDVLLLPPPPAARAMGRRVPTLTTRRCLLDLALTDAACCRRCTDGFGVLGLVGLQIGHSSGNFVPQANPHPPSSDHRRRKHRQHVTRVAALESAGAKIPGAFSASVADFPRDAAECAFTF
ncbi:hypothetical protein MRX96_046482 [Rhipicephalus microplus]